MITRNVVHYFPFHFSEGTNMVIIFLRGVRAQELDFLVLRIFHLQ